MSEKATMHKKDNRMDGHTVVYRPLEPKVEVNNGQWTIENLYPKDWKVVDDHTSDEAMRDIAGLGILEDGTEVIILDTPNSYFSVNEAYRDGADQWHLSDYSVGGTIDQRGGKSIDEAIKAYNEDYDMAIAEGQTWLKGKRIAAVHFSGVTAAKLQLQ